MWLVAYFILCFLKNRSSGIFGRDQILLPFACSGVRGLEMFHLMFVHYTFSSVWVSE